jgi:hypothetical protein
MIWQTLVGREFLYSASRSLPTCASFFATGWCSPFSDKPVRSISVHIAAIVGS